MRRLADVMRLQMEANERGVVPDLPGRAAQDKLHAAMDKAVTRLLRNPNGTRDYIEKNFRSTASRLGFPLAHISLRWAEVLDLVHAYELSEALK